MRKESDSLGEVEIPSDKYWGAQTERSRKNFKIGSNKMPLEVVYALVLVKKASAIVNQELGLLSQDKQFLIKEACDEILAGSWDEQFPLSVWQTGSGTQTNMNVNEVIANIANVKAGSGLGSKTPIHPNDDVNMSQSSNDTFPTAMHIAATTAIEKKLFPSLMLLKNSLHDKAKEFNEIIKVGRTHLMDATPLTLGQEFSGYAAQIDHGITAVDNSLSHLSQIALGGTAVGTGLNAPNGFAEKTAEQLSKLTDLQFISAPNKFEALASSDAIIEASGALKRVACSFMKLGNDIRILASGPRCGIGEILLPENEPGSSIMPGKVNPTQCEALTMVCTQIIGNDVTIGVAGSQGQLELNVFRPVMIFNFLQSVHLLADAATNFTNKCLVGIRANKKRIDMHLENTLMLATALNREIGYDKASKIVREAHTKGITLKEAALSLGVLDEEIFDAIVDPTKMI